MRIEPLTASHPIDAFDCGEASLNLFLWRHALPNEGAGGCRTYVAADDGRVVGFYSLAAGSVEYADATTRLRAGLARHPIPVMVLARFAVDHSCQRSGIGRGMLKDTFVRAVRAAEIIGIRALLVHAKDEAARAWYHKQAEFEPSSPDPLQLLILMKDIRRMLR
jgi:GNAT superfamily N-acetyltransferase